MECSIVILEVLAEGGGLTLYGQRLANEWRYSLESLDQTPWLIDEPTIQGRSKVVSSWEAAIALMDCYPWYRLMPGTIHPDFRAKVWLEFQHRQKANEGSPRKEQVWREACLGQF